jgi:hypothetical protein
MSTADGEHEPSEIDDPRPPRWRRVVGRILVVLFGITITLSLVLNWVAFELLNTDRFVETMSDLSADPAIQEAIGHNISNQLVGLFNADATSADATEGGDQILRGLARSAATEVIDRTVLRVIQSPEFQQRWDEAIQIAHPHIVALLEGEEYDNLQIVDGQVVIDLGPLIVRVQDRLREAGLDFVDRISPGAINTTFVIFESSALASAQQWIDWLLTWRILFPVIALACLIGYVVFSVDRKSATIWTGMSVVIAMTTLLVALAVGRRYILDHLDPARDANAISIVLDELLDGLRQGARVLALAGVLVSVLAWLLWADMPFRAPAAAFARRYRTALLAGIAAVTCLPIMFADTLSISAMILIVFFGLLAAVVTWWFARSISGVDEIEAGLGTP